MKIFCSFLLSIMFIPVASSQVVNLDSLFLQGQQYHAEGMRLFMLDKKEEALQQLNLATDAFRDFQDLLYEKPDSVIKIFEKVLD